MSKFNLMKFIYFFLGFLKILYLIIFKTKNWDNIFYFNSQIPGTIEKKFVEESFFKKLISKYILSNTTAKELYNSDNVYKDYQNNFNTNPKRILTDNLMKNNIVNLINEDKNIKNIVEIGSMDGNFIHLLSEKFENINFYGIDYKVNRKLEKKNLKFLNFQKNIFENFDINVNDIDLIFFKEVAVLLNSKEIIEFYNLISDCKYISFVEFDFIKRLKLNTKYNKTLNWHTFFYTHDYESLFVNHKILSEKFDSVLYNDHSKRYVQSCIFTKK